MKDIEIAMLALMAFTLILTYFMVRMSARNQVKASGAKHDKPTTTAKKKHFKAGGGYISGIYHCEDCNVAGHICTLGAGPCHKCGKKMHRHEARWDNFSGKWVFRKDEH